jgi:N-acetylneuraminic acid mutarotase
MGGIGDDGTLSSMKRYDVASGQWSAMAAMSTSRHDFDACVVAREIYVTGGFFGIDEDRSSSVEKFSPSSDTWSAVASMPHGRAQHAAVAVGSVIDEAVVMLGGYIDEAVDEHDDMVSTLTASVLKFDSTQDTWSKMLLRCMCDRERYLHLWR